MANPEHLAILKRGVQVWNDCYRETTTIVDLSRANLTGANLREGNLRGANLREADLRGAILTSSDLGLANLIGVNLREAKLMETDWYVFPFGRTVPSDPTRPQTSLKTAWRNARR